MATVTDITKIENYKSALPLAKKFIEKYKDTIDKRDWTTTRPLLLAISSSVEQVVKCLIFNSIGVEEYIKHFIYFMGQDWLIKFDCKDLEKMHDWMFNSCHNLIEVSIPDSVSYIHKGAFEECSKDLVIKTNNPIAISYANKMHIKVEKL